MYAEVPRRAHYTCRGKYYNDMGHFLIRLIWPDNVPRHVQTLFDRKLQDYIYQIAPSHTSEFFVDIPNTWGSAHFFSAKQPETSHNVDIAGATILLTVEWQGSSPDHFRNEGQRVRMSSSTRFADRLNDEIARSRMSRAFDLE